MSEPRFPLADALAPGRERLAAGAAGLVFSERRPGAFVEVAGWPESRAALHEAVCGALSIDGFPAAGRVAGAPGLTVLGLDRQRAQVLGEDAGLARRLSGAVPPATGSVVDLAGSRAGVRIEGVQAEALLQKGVSFDLSETAFPAMSVARTAIHHMGVTIVRLDAGTFDVFAFRSFAGSLWHWLEDAAVEFGWRSGAPRG